MATLRIEHAIRDYDLWKAAFDADPLGRIASGVRRHVVHRPVDDPKYVMIDLEFDDADRAAAFLTRLQTQVWTSPHAAPALAGAPQGRVLDTVETVESAGSPSV